MALSRVIKTGDGSTTQFVVDFAMGYLDQSNVTCRVGDEVDGTGAPIYRTITFVTESLMQISGAAPGNGVRVVFERTVEKEGTLVHFSDGDVMDEINLDLSFKQILMVVHEVLDGRFGQFDSDLDMGGFLIHNLGDPLVAQDVANKRYVDARIATGAASATAAAASAAQAAGSASSAAGSASASQTSRLASEAARDTSAAAAASAAGSVTAAANSASAAAGSASSASGSATAAAGSATTANTRATASANSAAAAMASQNAAAGSATTAANKASAASGSSTAASNSATAASGSASAAAGSAITASNAATTSTTNRDNAYKWASEAEDVAVDDGTRTGYSAYHWSKKAELAAGGGVSSWAGIAGTITKAQAQAAIDLGDYALTSSLSDYVLTTTYTTGLAGKADVALGNVTQANARTKVGTGSMAYRNLTVSTGYPTGGADGDVHYKV